MANEERHPPPWLDQALHGPGSVFASPEAVGDHPGLTDKDIAFLGIRRRRTRGTPGVSVACAAAAALANVIAQVDAELVELHRRREALTHHPERGDA